MCRYKPCVLWFHLNTFMCFLLVIFCMLMWLYTGDFYPSYRFKIAWFWSLSLYMYGTAVSIICSILLYKELPQIRLHQLCLLLLVAGIVCAAILVSLIWPKMTADEFEAYVFDHYEAELTVPRFMDYFQSRQKCCGISNYKDYINFLGTRTEKLPKGKEIAVFDVPRSCCQSESQVNRSCGLGISLKDTAEIHRRLNSDTLGCYEKFTKIIYKGEPFQVTIFHQIFRIGPILLIVMWVGLIGLYRYYYRLQFSSSSAAQEEDEEDYEDDSNTKLE